MPALPQSPLILLLITGSLLGLTFPFGKIATTESGVSPVVWAWVISAGSAIGLLFLRASVGRFLDLSSSYLRFYVISALVSLVIPNLIIFSVIPKLGAGFTGLLFTLSPVFTLAISLFMRVRVPNTMGSVGIVLGFVGAVVVALTRGEIGQPAGIGWVCAGMIIPASLAVGNIYRTVAWPEHADPLELAAGTNTAAAIMLFVLITVTPSASLPGGIFEPVWLMPVALIVSICMFPFFYQLQRIGGPTYLSQISYVAATIALFTGTFFLAERYSLVTWLGALLIFLGIFLSVWAFRSPE